MIRFLIGCATVTAVTVGMMGSANDFSAITELMDIKKLYEEQDEKFRLRLQEKEDMIAGPVLGLSLGRTMRVPLGTGVGPVAWAGAGRRPARWVAA